ncbi:MAG TPA: hypothetical protein VGR47_06450 [Terracidiphilus sp.]|nr:hypothetical protein [Terracidiphilus sp.]
MILSGSFRIFVSTSVLVLGLHANAQLDAPGALDTFAGCAHHTCTWVPQVVDKSFREGDLSYKVQAVSGEDTGGIFVLAKEDKVLLKTRLEGLDASVSVVWSNDHKNFAITWSDGGAIGNFHVRAFHLNDYRVSELPATKRAFDSFKARHWCEERGDNIQAHSWLHDSRDLLLVLSVYNTGDCGKEMGHMEAYVVEAATGRIQEHWDLKQLKSYIRSHPE